MPSPNPPRITPRASLAMDTARWGACLLVLIYHLATACLAPLSPQASPLVRALAALGDCGPPAVIWFFVLSGSLIGGGVIADIRRNCFSFRHYTLNRATRLYVVLLPALALGYALDTARLHGVGMSPVPGQESAANYGALVFLGNALCLQTLTVPTLGSNGPLWSLACEGWYYLLYPLLLAPLMRNQSRTTRIACLAAGLLALALLLAGNPRIPRLFLTWCLGAALRIGPRLPRRAAPLAWLVAGITMLAYPALLAAHGGLVNALVAGSFALALSTTLADERPVHPGLARHSANLAGFSFSLYLIHVPIIHATIALWNGSRDTALNLARDTVSGYVAMVLLAMLVTASAWLFSRGTEAKTAQFRKWIGKARALPPWLFHQALPGETLSHYARDPLGPETPDPHQLATSPN